jgi:hypothetical protein
MFQKDNKIHNSFDIKDEQSNKFAIFEFNLID